MSGSLNAQHSLKRFRRARSQRASKRPRTRTKYAYDGAGNTTSFGSNSFTYNQRGRASVATGTGGTTNYIYSALGQMIEKYGTGATSLIVYDEAGHLLGEYSSSGALVQETIWMGDTPIATLRPNGSSISTYYVHTDQLNAPRVITQPSTNTVAWRWDTDPFGTAAPNQNPASLGTFVYNLRFPGQYYQAETGVNYNYFRDYDPQTGRYIESDPIGLNGGINTYLYVHARPVSRTDKRGTGGLELSGSILDDIFQKSLPDTLCAIVPGSAKCAGHLTVCLEARCTYTDCKGRQWEMDVTFVPTPPNKQELANESPNCRCTQWDFGKDAKPE